MKTNAFLLISFLFLVSCNSDKIHNKTYNYNGISYIIPDNYTESNNNQETKDYEAMIDELKIFSNSKVTYNQHAVYKNDGGYISIGKFQDLPNEFLENFPYIDSKHFAQYPLQRIIRNKEYIILELNAPDKFTNVIITEYSNKLYSFIFSSSFKYNYYSLYNHFVASIYYDNLSPIKKRISKSTKSSKANKTSSGSSTKKKSKKVSKQNDLKDKAKFIIHSVTVKSIPSTNSRGGKWDNASNPDIIYELYYRGELLQSSAFNSVKDVSLLAFPIKIRVDYYSPKLNIDYVLKLIDEDVLADDFIAEFEFDSRKQEKGKLDIPLKSNDGKVEIILHTEYK